MTLTPAYGRDYTNRDKLLKDFHADKDFILHLGPETTYINKSQIKDGQKITFRYNRKSQAFTYIHKHV